MYGIIDRTVTVRSILNSNFYGVNMNKNNRLLTIGQFAAMHGINKKTLMWYDETGLFKPAVVNPENGYRCYNYHQSPVLETILLLRELDVSVSEIQDFMKNRSAGSMKCLLEEKITDLDAQITHLQAVRATLCNHHRNMETLLSMDLSNVSMFKTIAQVSGHGPANIAHRTVEVTRASLEQSQHLSIPLGEPMLFLNVYFLDEAEHPNCIGRQYYIGSRYMFEI